MPDPTRHPSPPSDAAHAPAELLTARIAAARSKLHRCRDPELASRALEARMLLGNPHAERAWLEEHLDELPPAERTAACRRHGWTDAIHRSAGTEAIMARAAGRRRLAAMTDDERADFDASQQLQRKGMGMPHD